MKKTILIALAILPLATVSAGAIANTRAVTCPGCSASQMSQAATNATDDGTVYVFNQTTKDVKKYTVLTEFVDTIPYTVLKEAYEVTVEPDIKNSFAAVVGDQIQGEGSVIVLPPDFPVRSSAGSLLDPNFASGSIVNHLRSLSFWQLTEINVNALIAAAITKNIPFADFSGVIKGIVITIRFPDGSTQDFEVTYQINALTNKATIDLGPTGTATTPEGTPVPTNPIYFAGTSYSDTGGSIGEWIAWARLNGVQITGPGGGNPASMTCYVEGSVVYCKVIQKP